MLKKILKYKLISILSVVSILLVLGGFFWAYALMRGLGTGPFILHFNDMTGITGVGGLGTIVFMGIFGFVVTVMNGCIALEFESRSSFFGKFIAAITLIFATLLFIGFVAILSVN